MSKLRLQDAHLHLQSPALYDLSDSIIQQSREYGITQMVVNGTCPDDWDKVSELAHRYPKLVIPSFGLHPWKTSGSNRDWKLRLVEKLDSHPNACIGECGLDRWMDGLDSKTQEDAFLYQLGLASERNLPITIHVLKAWGWLFDSIETHPLPERGFLLHSFNGSTESAIRLVRLGAYFSFSGHFLQAHKKRLQSTFSELPHDRILIETDSPDMLPPPEWTDFDLQDGLNHPANLRSIFNGFSMLRKESKKALAEQLELNFQRFFKE